jgi:site-specific DNA-cytosine methylase
MDKKINSNFEVVFSNQWEPSTKIQHASIVYEERWGKENHSNEDISQVETKRIPSHDLFVGGFPCQDYSVATTLKNSKGLIGKKGVLWWSIHRILNEKKSSSVAPKRPGFWRRLERSIRKRRKNYINQLGFDEKWYLNEYPDVAAAKCDPWTHYRDSGIHEGRYKSKKEKEKVLNQKGLKRYGPRG